MVKDILFVRLELIIKLLLKYSSDVIRRHIINFKKCSLLAHLKHWREINKIILALNECILTINLPYWFNTSFHYHAILILLNECKQLSAAAYTHQILIKDLHQYTIIISIIYYIIIIHFQFEINVLIKNIKMFKSTLAVLLLLKMHFVFSNHQNKQSNKKESSTLNLLLSITFVSKQYLQFDTSESNTTIKQNDCFLFRKLCPKFCGTNFSWVLNYNYCTVCIITLGIGYFSLA